MFDTIHFESDWTLKTRNHPDWTITYKTDQIVRQHERVPNAGIKAVHKALKIHAYGSYGSGTLTKFYVPSLPALLHGQNGMPFNGQPDVDLALAILDEILGGIATPRTPVKTYTRIDIPLNLLNLSYAHIDTALQRSNLPRSRTAPVHYIGESLTFRRNDTELQFYDKVLQSQGRGRITSRQGKRIPSFTRVELRLRGKDLDKALGNGRHVNDLDVNAAYRCLREHIISLGLTKNTKVHDHESFLARVGVEAPQLLDVYLRDCCVPAYARQLRKKVSALMPGMLDEPIDWEVVLPADHPPLQTQLHIPGCMDPEHKLLVNAVRKRQRARRSECNPRLLSGEAAQVR